MNNNEVLVKMPLPYNSNGIKHMEVRGPVLSDGRLIDGGNRIHLDMWIGHKNECNPAPPDFHIELDIASANNLRNAIAAAVMMLS